MFLIAISLSRLINRESRTSSSSIKWISRLCPVEPVLSCFSRRSE